jgi:hypothetical protein
VITEPGVYDIPADEYHRDPVADSSLSSSGARLLLPPSCPAIFRHRQDNPVFKDEFDFGHAAHQMVLGAGAEIEIFESPTWNKKADQEGKKASRQEGRIPLLRKDYKVVEEMAAALRRHPVASALLNPEYGMPEQALVWRDERTGVWRRALLDWLPQPPATGRMIVPDYKTTASANPESIQKSAYNFGYHQQADWYLDGVKTLGLAQDPAFVFIFQEKSAPYLVTVVQLDAIAMRLAREKNREAIDLYRKCSAADRWPGYSDDVELIGLPSYIENQYLKESA